MMQNWPRRSRCSNQPSLSVPLIPATNSCMPLWPRASRRPSSIWEGLQTGGRSSRSRNVQPKGRPQAAAQLKLIDDLALWNQFLNARNLSVHNCVGMDDEEMIGLVQQFRDRLRPLLQ
jgi:hypothetical protein